MKIIIEDFEIVSSSKKFIKPATMTVDGVKYLVYHTKTTDNGNGTLTIELEASEDWTAANEKEEKKMLNVDKYREEIEKLGEYSLPCGLAELRGFDYEYCERTNCCGCVMDSLFWLVKKYEPPLLKNGDGLKPGDWIMVRDRESDEWRKKQFVFCHNGWFYCLLEGNNFAQINLPTIRYEQARLPEEGE